MEKDNDLDVLGTFDDETDCAILNDKHAEDLMVALNNNDSTVEEELEDEVEPIDTNIGYEDSISTADVVDIDTDDMIAAARDIANNPFEEDEIIDAVEVADSDE